MIIPSSSLNILLFLLSCPITTSESSDTTTPSSSKTSTPSTTTTTTTTTTARETECYSYGCPMLPQDVAYDSNIQEALTIIRDLCGLEDAKPSSDELTKLAMQMLESSGGNDAATLTLIGYKGGPLENQINQDRAFVISPFRIDGNEGEEKKEENTANNVPQTQLLGVFDGHGRLGEVVSQYAVTTLPELLSSKLQTILRQSSNNDNDSNIDKAIKNAITESFLQIDKTIPTAGVGGCTASIILQLSPPKSKLYIANAGDSRSFIATHHVPTQTTNIVYATREDKAHLPEEQRRVEQMGGEILYPQSNDERESSRVLLYNAKTDHRASIAMSRSIGDWDFGKIGVIPDPIVDSLDVDDVVKNEVERLRTLQEEDGSACAAVEGEGKEEGEGTKTCEVISEEDVRVFAVSATDGLLDYIPPDELMSFVASSLFPNDDDGDKVDRTTPGALPCVFTSLEELIYSAARGWHEEMGGQYRDDIAIATSIIR